MSGEAPVTVPVIGASVVALLRAHHRNDVEGVRAIVTSSDPLALVDALAEVAVLMGVRAYGSPAALDGALSDLLRWLAALDTRRT
jgi:hypothetical protein